MNEAAVVVSDPKKVKEKNSKMVDQDLSPSSEDGDVASKLSDLSESSTDNGLQRHDDMMMMDHTTSSNNNKNTATTSFYHRRKEIDLVMKIKYRGQLLIQSSKVVIK